MQNTIPARSEADPRTLDRVLPIFLRATRRGAPN